MKKNDKERLFEVMGRLDKTFKKPKLNEGIEDDGMLDTGQAPDLQDMPAPEAMPGEEVPVEEKSPEEKLAELTAKVDEMHAMLHGEEEAPAEEPEEIEVTTGEVDAENLQEWNFDKKKGEKEEEKAEDKKEDEKEEVDEDVNITVTEKKGKALSAEKAPEVEIGK